MPFEADLAPTNVILYAPGDGGGIRLSWTNSASVNWQKTVIQKSTIGFVESPFDPNARQVYSGIGTQFFDADVQALKTYYYTVFGINDIVTAGVPTIERIYTNALTKVTNNLLWLLFGSTREEDFWGWNPMSQVSAMAVKDYGFLQLLYGA